MKQVTINLFSFSELTEKAQRKALDDFKNQPHYPYSEWYDFVKSDFHTILELIGFYNIDSYFSGFCSQGDGASFSANYSYKKGCLKTVKKYVPLDKELHQIVKALIGYMKRYNWLLECAITTQGTYCHSNTMRFNWDLNGSYCFDWRYDSDESEIEQLFKDLADWYYNQLEKEYEHQISDEYIKELIAINEYSFLASGELY